MGLPSRDEMIEDLISSDLNSMDIDALVNYFRDSSLEYYEDMSQDMLEDLYTEYKENVIIS